MGRNDRDRAGNLCGCFAVGIDDIVGDRVDADCGRVHAVDDDYVCSDVTILRIQGRCTCVYVGIALRDFNRSSTHPCNHRLPIIFVVFFKFIGDCFQTQAFKRTPGRITGGGTPSFELIEQGLELFELASVYVPVHCVEVGPLTVYFSWQKVVGIGVVRAVYIIGEMNVVPVSALQRPDRLVQIPNLPAHLYPVQKGEIPTGYRVEERGFRLSGRADQMGIVGIHEVRPAPIAQQCRLLPEPGVVPVPGHQFGNMRRVHILGAVIQHLHIARIGDHFVRVYLDGRLSCGKW